MTYHDRRLGRIPAAARRKSGSSLMLDGLLTLNIFQTLPSVRRGSIAGDWKKVGGDLRLAMEKNKPTRD